jgi:hypothetical protein
LLPSAKPGETADLSRRLPEREKRFAVAEAKATRSGGVAIEH